MTDSHSSDGSAGRPGRRLLSAVAVALGVGSGAVAEAPRSVAPHAAPQAWLDYAGLVSQQIVARLDSGDAVALRLRDYLNALPGADQATGAMLRLSLWIDGKGRITRIDFPLFAHPQPNDDLNALLVGATLPQTPPKGMLLPLRLSVRVKPQDEPRGKALPTAWTDRRLAPRPATSVRVTYALPRNRRADDSAEGQRG